MGGDIFVDTNDIVEFLDSSDGEFNLVYDCGFPAGNPTICTDDCLLKSSSTFYFKADIRGFYWPTEHSDGDARGAAL
jgi:hypothetical protein